MQETEIGRKGEQNALIYEEELVLLSEQDGEMSALPLSFPFAAPTVSNLTNVL